MENFDNIENDVHICPKCGQEIPFGSSYYSITRNLEFFCKNTDTNEVEIETEDSEEVISLCKSCGSVFNQTALEIILEHLPIPGHETRN